MTAELLLTFLLPILVWTVVVIGLVLIVRHKVEEGRRAAQDEAVVSVKKQQDNEGRAEEETSQLDAPQIPPN